MPAGLGHRQARTQSCVAERPQGALLSLRQDLSATARRAGLVDGPASLVAAVRGFAALAAGLRRPFAIMSEIAARRAAAFMAGLAGAFGIPSEIAAGHLAALLAGRRRAHPIIGEIAA